MNEPRWDAEYVARRKAAFWAKVVKSDGCWLWTGGIRVRGYGSMSFCGRPTLVHRLAYEWEVAPIPSGLVIDHLCRNRSCVNPAHLEVVTVAENTRRGESFAARNARKTHCSKHPDIPLVAVASGDRRCSSCVRHTGRRAYIRIRDKKRLLGLRLNQPLSAARVGREP